MAITCIMNDVSAESLDYLIHPRAGKLVRTAVNLNANLLHKRFSKLLKISPAQMRIIALTYVQAWTPALADCSNTKWH